jgi:hypothetical protein
MQQHDFNALIQEEQHKFNRSKKEEVVLRYRFASPPYYQEGEKNDEFERRAFNFEPPIHYVVEEEVASQGIKISKGVELVLVTKQEIVILPRAEPILLEGVPMFVRVRYSEPKVNHQNGSINSGVLRDWNRGIHNVNKVPRRNSPRCTYCHQIGH